MLWQLVVPLCKVVGKVCIWISPPQVRAGAAELLLKPPQLVKVIVPVCNGLRDQKEFSLMLQQPVLQPMVIAQNSTGQ